MLESISSILGPSGGIIAAIGALIGLLIVCYLIFQMVRQPNFGSGRRNKKARLAISEAINFGPKHKLVLLRRDDIEHLVLIGGPSDILIEGNIRRNTAVRPRELQPGDSATPAAPNSSIPGQETATRPAQRLRPVANEAPSKSTRPQFVPRKEPVDQQSDAVVADARQAVSVATPHIRPVSTPPVQPVVASPDIRTEPLPPLSAPTKASAVVGAAAAAPLVASAITSGSVSNDGNQESPFKDQSATPETSAIEENQSASESPSTTVAPQSDSGPIVKKGGKSGGSVADDMDALLNELGAKR